MLTANTAEPQQTTGKKKKKGCTKLSCESLSGQHDPCLLFLFCQVLVLFDFLLTFVPDSWG